jgi:hypothetical protein
MDLFRRDDAPKNPRLSRLLNVSTTKTKKTSKNATLAKQKVSQTRLRLML